MKFRTIFTHVIGSIHIAPCPTDLQTPHRGPTQLANDHRPPATSSLAHWLTAHRLTDLYCPTGSPAHWPPATSHQPPTTGHLLTCSPAHRPPATCSPAHRPPATGHRPPGHPRPATGHRPPATGHRLTGHRLTGHGLTGHRLTATRHPVTGHATHQQIPYRLPPQTSKHKSPAGNNKQPCARKSHNNKPPCFLHAVLI